MKVVTAVPYCRTVKQQIAKRLDRQELANNRRKTEGVVPPNEDAGPIVFGLHLPGLHSLFHW
jgi:hypothetical protein